MKRIALFLVGAVFVAGADEVKTDKEKLKGRWRMASIEREGKEVEASKNSNVWIAFEGDKMTIYLTGQELEGTYKIDPTKNPKTIDTNFNGQQRLGIYELNGDTLKVCRGNPGEGRPAELKTREGSSYLVSVYKREKK